MKIKDALQLLIPVFEARILLSHAMGFSREWLIGHSEDELSDEIYVQFFSLVERRKAHEPIAYIIGKKEFYGRDFKVTKDVLIPRADSETLIDAVLKDYKNGISILELGVGSGCLLLTALLELKQATGIGVDISREALEVASANATLHGLQDRCSLVKSNWFENVAGKFDIIISNPPYIEENERSIMAIETLQYEPQLALFGGIEAYKIIASDAHKFLKENGRIYLEIGYRQESLVEEIFLAKEYKVVEKYRDIENRMRVLVFGLD